MTAARAIAEVPAAAAVPATPIAGARWLHSRGFDMLFVGGTASLALLAALAMAIDSRAFGVIIVFDLWVLGYHHVIATFARIGAEADGWKRYRSLVTWVPIAVLLGVVALAAGVGVWTLPTVYLYWQWWHYTRQSYGVAQLYRLKNARPDRSLNEMKALIYALPFAGILYRSYQSPETFLSLELRTIPVPLLAVEAAGAVALSIAGWWALRRFQAWRAGELAVAYDFYLLTHLVIFATGYVAFDNIDHGWLVINMWHNAQYLLIVWMFNNKRFKEQVDPAQRLLSTLSQRRNVARYFLATFAVSTVVYLTLSTTLALVSASALTLTLVAYQTINFHHYIVDSLVWKVRRPAVRANLGLDQAA